MQWECDGQCQSSWKVGQALGSAGPKNGTGLQPHPPQSSGTRFIVSHYAISFMLVSEKEGCSESFHMAGCTKPHPRHPKVQNIYLNLSGPQRCALAALRIYCLFSQRISLTENREGNMMVLENITLRAVLQTSWIKSERQSLGLTKEPLMSHLVLVMQVS